MTLSFNNIITLFRDCDFQMSVPKYRLLGGEYPRNYIPPAGVDNKNNLDIEFSVYNTFLE